MANLAATILLALARRIGASGVIINEHTLTRAQTCLHVQVLRRWFEFIRLEDLPHRLLNRGSKPFCLFTLDDGKRSNFTVTAPELERLRVPAAFYLTSGLVTSGSGFWFDRHEQLVSALGHCPAGLELDTLKRLPFDLLTDRLERACAEHNLRANGDSDDRRPMSWDEARDLCRRGFTIGAHGVTHAILTLETRERAFTEIEESLARVTSETGVPCTTFAFPNGNYDGELSRHALRCGANTLMTTEPMWADKSATLWRLPRIQLFGSFSRTRIESKIALAAFRGILANPDGSGRKYRHMHRETEPLAQGVPVAGMGY